MSRLQFIYRYTTASGKTKLWTVHSGDTKLGEVAWYSHWRRYVFYPNGSTLFDVECLKDIVAFLELENENHKKKNKVNV